VRCEEPMRPVNGNVSVSGYYYGAVAKFWCLPEHRLNGSDSATCQQSGNWSSPAPECLPLAGYYWRLFLCHVSQAFIFSRPTISITVTIVSKFLLRLLHVEGRRRHIAVVHRQNCKNWWQNKMRLLSLLKQIKFIKADRPRWSLTLPQ